MSMLPPARPRFSVRPARLTDLELIWDLEQRIFPRSERFSKRRLRYLLGCRNAEFVLCLQSSRCAGYGIALFNRLRNREKKGRIYSIGLLAEYRNHGGGAVLLRALEDCLWRGGASFITLETKKSRKGAVRFFRRHGYTELGTLPHYYGSRHGVRMKKHRDTPGDAPLLGPSAR